ncbi:MAG: sensor histidine kinase [Planctomycetota bacterium]
MAAPRPIRENTRVTENRPDPDALLARTAAEEPQPRRGRLKLFFGASAGVGKTYAMLSEARERRAAGTDVVVGYVETHQRPETTALLGGLDTLPPRWVEYRGVRLREFDLDAALDRKPQLIVVDELAHTNAEGLRHAKRWQDVLDLLDAGIDVYTTVNVQHVESLNDVIAQITGVVVRETIPDSIIERADEIELVDLPPDDLLQRLREGKVYIPEQAERAAQHFFRKEVLVALRELALRQTAQRVSQQVQVEKAGRAIGGTWATNERLLVCVGPSPLSARVVRTARRMAASMHCEWLAVAVETPGFTATGRERTRRTLKLAENLGAETLTLSGERIADEIIAFARKRSVTKIIIGKPAAGGPWAVFRKLQEFVRGSIVEALIRLSGDIDVHVVKGEADPDVESIGAPHLFRAPWREFAFATAIVAASTLVAWPLSEVLSPVNVTMIFLAGVVFVATRSGLGPSALAAVLAPLAYNFFFTQPYYSLAIRDWQYVVTFLALLATALLVSGLAQRVRRQAEAIRTRYHRTAALYFMSRQLAAAPNRQTLASVAARHVSDVFAGDALVLLPDRPGVLAPIPAPPAWFAGNEPAAAQWVFDHQKWAGRGTDTLPACRAIYLPLLASGKPLGVLALNQRGNSPLEPDQRHMLETFATQLAIALERSAFAEDAAAARVAADAEQTRNALLSSVSHDLRTPLATIAGTASMLLEPATRIDAEQRNDLMRSIADEAARMNDLVAKLLDMTRLESAGFSLALDGYPMQELVGAALTHLESRLARHVITTDLPADLVVRVDGPLVEQLLSNLLENAAKYTPPGSSIHIRARREAGAVIRIDVCDNGPGLPAGATRTIFEKFERQRPAGDRSGVGLGLTICRTIVRLHGGEIGAENLASGGARFWFTLPAAEVPLLAGAGR